MSSSRHGIAELEVGTAELAALAVTAAKLGAGSVEHLKLALDAVLRENLGESVLCDDGAAGEYHGTGTGDRTLVDLTFPSDTRYLRVDFRGNRFQNWILGVCLIDVAAQTLVGGYYSITYNGTNPYGAAISGAISAPHTVGADYTGAFFKITAWSLAAHNLKVVLVGSASGAAGCVVVEAIR